MSGDKRLLDNNMLVLAVDIALMKDNFAQAKRSLLPPSSFPLPPSSFPAPRHPFALPFRAVSQRVSSSSFAPPPCVWLVVGSEQRRGSVRTGQERKVKGRKGKGREGKERKEKEKG
eukprot:2243582-Rhodomonas_salina.1